jgi:hypothetical protein
MSKRLESTPPRIGSMRLEINGATPLHAMKCGPVRMCFLKNYIYTTPAC